MKQSTVTLAAFLSFIVLAVCLGSVCRAEPGSPTSPSSLLRISDNIGTGNALIEDQRIARVDRSQIL